MEALRLLTKLNFYKLFNIILAYKSYLLSNIFKKVIVWGKPLSLSIEPTNYCNLKCAECPTGNNALTRKKGNIDLNLYKKVVSENKKSLTYLLLYFQGEPFLNKDIYDMILYASNSQIYTMTSTNGHFITEETAKKIIESKLDKLIISVDGTTQETYEKYRIGGNLQTVLNGIQNLTEEKKRQNKSYPYIELQFLILKSNEHQIPKIKELGKYLGVNKVSLKTAQIYDLNKGIELIPTIQKYSRYEKNSDSTYTFKRKLKNKCWRAWSSAVVSIEGNVVPCCYDKDTQYVMGNLNENSLHNIWKNTIYTKFRKTILTKKKSLKMCEDCVV